MDWSLLLNDTQLAAGTIPHSDTYTSDNPLALSDGAADPSDLRNVPVSIRDAIELRFEKAPASPYATFAGVKFTIHAIPEPLSMAFMGSAFVGVVGWRLRKRRREAGSR